MPTTAGTGSEATSFSVVYLGKKKFSIASEKLLPEYIIADVNTSSRNAKLSKSMYFI